MPARRQRNERWRDYLREIIERGGGIEIAPLHTPAEQREPQDAPTPSDLVWRVKVLAIDGDTLTCEAPGTLGRSATIPEDMQLLAAVDIGQNRWMFHSRVLARTSLRMRGRQIPAVRLELPEHAERCRRRAFERISTGSLQLPSVTCSVLLDPATAVEPELACRLAMLDGGRAGQIACERPLLGATREAMLVNIGGGGVGLRFENTQPGAIDTSRLQWLEMDLSPWLPAPLAVTGRVAHQRIDSDHVVHAGVAFEFAFNPAHRDFVVEQIMRASRGIAAAA